MENKITNIVDKNAIVNDDSNEAYHGNKDYIGSTSVKLYKKSPLHYKTHKVETSPALEFGTLYHTFVLEPDKFKEEYYLFDDSIICEELVSGAYFDDKGKQIFAKSPRANKIYKEWFANQMIICNDRKMVGNEELEMIKKMKDTLFSHPYARYLLTGGISELSHYTELNGVKVKVRPDHMFRKKKICVDLKTAKSAKHDEFPRAAYDLGYHVSAAMYSDVLEQIYTPGEPWTFFFVVQEKTFPYAFNIFKSSPQFMSIGQYEYEILLEQHRYCLENDDYRGYQVFADNKFGIQGLEIPAYLVKELTFYNEYKK